MINEGSGKTICTYKVMRKVKFLGVLLGFVWKRGIQRGEKFLVGRWQCVQALASQCPGPCDYQEEPLSNLSAFSRLSSVTQAVYREPPLFGREPHVENPETPC